MKKITRKYKVKDVNMILAADIIIGHAIANKDFLVSKRTTWKDPFFEDFHQRINNAIETYLGADNAKELRGATQKVHAVLNPVKELLTEVKVQIEEDFKSTPERRDEILNNLGFTENYKGVKLGDQESAIELLYRFKTNLTPELQLEITNAGISGTTLGTLIDHSDKLRDANVTQEISKGYRKVLTAETITEFNAIYSILITVNRVASNFFKKERAKKELFSFNKTTNEQQS
jgi:hypothetical protein